MSVDEEKILVQVASMYYEDGKMQSEISKILGIHRSTISRLLKQSREQGIVKISIDYGYGSGLQTDEELKKKFNLKELIIVPNTPEDTSDTRLNALGQVAAEYFLRILEPHSIVAFSWGKTLAAFVHNLPSKKSQDLLCIPLIGGPAGKLVSQYHVNTIVFEAAKRLNAQSMLIDSPAVADNEALCQGLLQTEYNKKLSRLWEEIDIAIFGIGSPAISMAERWRGFYGDDILGMLTERQAVGDIVSRFFNQSGEKITSEFDRRVIGAQLSMVKKATYAIAIAESVEKVEAIHAALVGGYCNVLITNDQTIEKLKQQLT